VRRRTGHQRVLQETSGTGAIAEQNAQRHAGERCAVRQTLGFDGIRAAVPPGFRPMAGSRPGKAGEEGCEKEYAMAQDGWDGHGYRDLRNGTAWPMTHRIGVFLSFGLYMEVHVPAATRALRRRGADVMRAQEDGASRLPDAKLLDRASAMRRIVFSQPARSFLL